MNKLWDCPTCGRGGFDRVVGRCLYCWAAIPHIITGRNPQNHEHVVSALQLLQLLGGVAMTEKTAAETKALGLPIPKHTKVVQAADHAVAVGMPFLLQRGLLMPDNVIMTCQTCRMPIQYRPETAHSRIRHVCVFCAADECLKEFWRNEPPSP